MGLKKDTTAPASPVQERAREIAEQYNQAADERQKRDFSKLNKTTETVAFRIPTGERNRIRLLFARHGMTMAEGIKKALYEYLKVLEGTGK